jgi:D-alanyl-D-alanine carboxypeptidase/D-alanyl-D-alanine-endopeptidase (penicillin-binding protein 4)
LAAIEDLADQVVSRGVKRIDGNIEGDDTAYVWAPYAEGWTLDDTLWEYGAAVSALAVNDNAFNLTVEPGGRAGEPARVTAAPPVEYYLIDNRVRTTAGGARRIHIDRGLGGRQLRVWGSIPAGDKGQTNVLGIDDPAWYAARALYDALARRGVAIAGGVSVRHLFPNQVETLEAGPAPPPEPGVELARRASAPLAEDLRITDKVSQNLHAEMLLRAVARARRGIGSREAGLEEMKTFLDEAGIPRDAYSFNDGSGLARLNLVTPAAVVRLLRYMWNSPARGAWTGLLPVGGQDGTLSNRFTGTLAAGRIRAKTGTLSGVSALSGYATRPRGGTLAFAILVNNYLGDGQEVRAAMDRICNLMVE